MCVNLGEIGWDDLTQARDQWNILVKAVMYLGVPKSVGALLTGLLETFQKEFRSME